MSATPIYEERLGANTLLIVGVSLWSLALGLVPGIIFGGWWWLFAIYIGLTFGIIFAFFQMRVQLFKDKAGGKVRLYLPQGYRRRQDTGLRSFQDGAPGEDLRGVGHQEGQRRHLFPDPGLYQRGDKAGDYRPDLHHLVAKSRSPVPGN